MKRTIEHEYNRHPQRGGAQRRLNRCQRYLVPRRDAVALVDRIITRDAYAMADTDLLQTPGDPSRPGDRL